LPAGQQGDAPQGPRLRIFVHAGFHKTGTTSFQQCLRDNAQRFPPGMAALTARDPIMRRLTTLLKHHRVAPSRWTLRRVETCLADLRTQLKDDKISEALMSLERISGNVPRPDFAGGIAYRDGRPVLEAFARVFAADDLTFAFTIREAAAWRESLVGHRLATRGNLAPTGNGAAPQINWDAQILALTNGLACNVLVSQLELTRSSALGVGSDILSAFANSRFDISGWQPARHLNRGLSDDARRMAELPQFRWLPGFVRARILRRFRLGKTVTEHDKGAN
jgi:hypothetical protein